MFTAMMAVAFVPRAARAQATPCGASRSVFAAVGIAQDDRVDASASAAQFEGRGEQYSVGGDAPFRRLCVVANIRAQAPALAATGRPLEHEHMLTDDGDLAALRRVSGFPDRHLSIWAGAELRGLLMVTSHVYPDRQRSTARFRFGMVSLGPVLRGQFVLGRSSITARLSSPVVGLVDHSYSAIWSGDSRPDFRVTSLSTLRGATGDMSYTWAVHPDLGINTAYRASMVRYDGARPVRSLTQSMTLGASVRFPAHHR